MEFTKVIAQAPTAPPSYEDIDNHNAYQQETLQRQQNFQSTYPHPNSQSHISNMNPNVQGQTNFHAAYPQAPGHLIITQAPTSIVRLQDNPFNTNSIAPLGDHPTMTKCMKCNSQIVTNVEYYNSNVTYCISGVLCLTAWYCCCCFLPCCLTRTKNVKHYCPQCKILIGTYEKKMC
uniref:CSON004292 protein n=1 Tax=Culicoides sonorensis TaxID=179676 RepID=A0A336LET8_CULSO